MEVSVIVPVYNVETYLPRCMESLLAQTFTDREIILVDDGSMDKSGSLCDEYCALEGISVIHQENMGLGLARNSGMKKAVGKYILFLDSDDYFGEDLLKELYDAAESQKADLTIGGFTTVYPDGRTEAFPYTRQPVIFSERRIKDLALNIAGSLPKERQDSKYGVSACARLYRRDIITGHGLRFVSERKLISEDLIFNLDFLYYAKRAVVIGTASYFYCTNAGSLSKRPRSDRFQKDCELYEAVRKRLNRFCGENEYELYLHRLLISRARFDMIQEVIFHDRTKQNYPLRKAVKSIVDRKELQAALRGYPWKHLPMMQGIFTYMMKKRRISILILLIRLKQRFRPGNQNI